MPPLNPDDADTVEVQCAGCGTTGLTLRAGMAPEMLAEGVMICEDCAPKAESIIAEMVGPEAEVIPGGFATVHVPPGGGLPTVREMGELTVAFARACAMDDMDGSAEIYLSLPVDARMGLTIYLGKLLAHLVDEDEGLWEQMRQWAAGLPDIPPGSMPDQA